MTDPTAAELREAAGMLDAFHATNTNEVADRLRAIADRIDASYDTRPDAAAEMIRLTFTTEDVASIAEAEETPYELALLRVQEWAKAIEGTACQLVNEQLASVIASGTP